MKKIYLYLSGIILLSILCGHVMAQNAITVAGGNGRGSAANQLNAPLGIDVDAAGNVYIADNGNFRVAKWAPGAAQTSVIAGRPNSQSNSTAVYPYDVFLDGSNNLYVSNLANQSVTKYAPGDTAGVIVAGGNGIGTLPSQMVSPAGLCVDASGNIYVVSVNLANVKKWPPGSPYGTVVIQINSQSGPKDDLTHFDLRDVFIDKEGNLFVVDYYRRRILKYPPGSTYPLTESVAVAGNNGQGSAANKLDNPQSVFVDDGGNIYIADAGNNRIQKWAPGATSGVTVAGGNGAGSAANQLNNPVSVVVDAAGYIYVCDQGNDRVQKFPPSGGLTYKYYEGSWSSLPDFSKIIPVKTGVSTSTNIGVRPTGRDDNFAFLWEGYINIPTAGNYTFETVSDDGSKIYFNSQYSFAGTATVNNDGPHAANSSTGIVNIQAGTYPIAISFFEATGGESMQVYWSGPGFDRQLIPASAFTQLPPERTTSSGVSGLTYKYYEGGYDILPDFTSLTPVSAGSSGNCDLGIRRLGVNDSFAIVWEGYINIESAGNYTFETISDDGSKLYISGAPVVNNDSTHPPKSAMGNINFSKAGRYPIRVEYFENYGAESFQVFWSGPGIPRQQIPDKAFVEGGTSPVSYPGLEYSYYEGLDTGILPDFNTLTPTISGITSGVNILMRPVDHDYNFAFKWQGFITLAQAGTYTFSTISDDGSKVYFNTPYSVNAPTLVNNDGEHPAIRSSGTVTVAAPGAYPITVTYFNRYGTRLMQLYYSGPGVLGGEQFVPSSLFTTRATPPPAPTAGLNYKYYEGDFTVLPDFNALTPVKTGKSDNVDLTVRTPGRDDHFAFLWEGTINIPAPGIYTFETVSDDGSKLYFNTPYSSLAIPTVDNDGLHAATSSSGSVNIPTAGLYPIAITFFENDGGEQMQVYWSGPGLPRQLIPNIAFNPSAAASAPNLRSIIAEGLIKDTKVMTRFYPNPFRESFNIDFYNSSAANKVQVGIYDLKGRLVYLRDAGNIAAGNVMLQVKPVAKLLPGGVYITKLQINGISSKVVKLVKVE